MKGLTFRYRDSDIYLTEDGHILTDDERRKYEETGSIPEKLYYQPKDGKISLCINGRINTCRVTRLVWEAVNNAEIKTTETVVCYNGNTPDCPDIKDIQVLSRKDFFQTYPGKNKQAIFDEETCAIIRNEYNQEERQKHSFKGPWSKPSYKDLAVKWNCSKSTIYKIVMGDYKCKKGESSFC